MMDVTGYRQDIKNISKGMTLAFAPWEEACGTKTGFLKKIIGPSILMIPEDSNCARGIINLHGNIFPAIEKKIKQIRQTVPYKDKTSSAVIETRQFSAGLFCGEEF